MRLVTVFVVQFASVEARQKQTSSGTEAVGSQCCMAVVLLDVLKTCGRQESPSAARFHYRRAQARVGHAACAFSTIFRRSRSAADADASFETTDFRCEEAHARAEQVVLGPSFAEVAAPDRRRPGGDIERGDALSSSCPAARSQAVVSEMSRSVSCARRAARHAAASARCMRVVLVSCGKGDPSASRTGPSA